MSELLDRSRVIYESLPITDLKAAGIWPAPDYELIFNYPPYQTLEPIGRRDIFKTGPFEAREVAVYVHIPFCQSTCAYCHYARRPRSSYLETKRYLACLERESSLLTTFSHIDLLRIGSFQSLHVGGGTPSCLYPPQLEELMIFPHLWNPDRIIEKTIEVNPASLTQDWLETARSLRFNRLNIGVQSFEDQLLKVCHRPHNRQQAIDAIKMARAAGFENINIDLIFGLPGQSFEDWQRTLEIAIELNLASITCYKLRRKKATPFGRLPDSAFPSPEDQLLMHIMAIESLTDAGYIPWHFETLFVRDPKYSHQHQAYKWRGLGELLGLGVSAYSYINDCVYHNTSSLEEYYEAIRHEQLPIKVGQRLDVTELKHRWMVLGLLTLRVEQEPFRERFGISPVETFASQLEPLVKLGLVEITEEEVQITKYPGLLFVMEVLTRFYSQRVTEILVSKNMHYGSFPAR